MPKSQPAHHELPQYYLSGFTEPGTSFIWEFERNAPYLPGTKYGNNPRKRGVSQVGIRPDGYAAFSRDGKRHFDFELALQKQEVLADDAIRKARSFESLSLADKSAIAGYAVLMWKRVSSQNVMLRSLVEQHFDIAALDVGARAFANVGKFSDARLLLDDAAWYRSELGKMELSRETLVSEFDQVRSALFNLTWIFYRASGADHFITSDVPVTYDRAAGLRNSPLYFPLSREVLLVASWTGADDLALRQTDPEEVRAINTFVVTHADRHVYASKSDEWIQRLFR